MSRRFEEEPWGPSHQEYEWEQIPFKRRHPILAFVVIPLFVIFFGIPFTIAFLETLSAAFGFGGGVRNGFSFLIVVVVMFVIGRFVLLGGLSLVTRPRRLPRNKPPPLRTPLGRQPHNSPDRGRTPVRERPKGVSPAARAREGSMRLGGGAYLGTDPDGMWVTADPESAVMVLGPPRSGKTSAVMIPALMACCGPAISTSTKPDVMQATLAARSEIGQAWLFDPSGTETDDEDLPEGVRRLCWSPVAAANTWDEALVMAKAMTSATRPGAGTTNENHWTERAAALLAPLLHAANQTGQPIAEVLRWTLRQDLAPALAILNDSDAPIAADVLTGIERTDQRERSSIFSATAGVLAAYNSDAVRTAAASPNFDPVRFATSTDAIYITAPEHKQALCAPLIVGLLEQIRHAVYDQARNQAQAGMPMHAAPPMLWALDELANTAPIHDLPALISQAGGQGLQVMVGLQDLAQARARWGDAQADGLLSLFQTKLILSGIADTRTLESISLSLGEYDRETVGQSIGSSEPQEWLSTPTHSDTVSYGTQRQRVLTPGEIAKLPAGHALLLSNAKWALLGLTPWHTTEPWKAIGPPRIHPPPRSTPPQSANPIQTAPGPDRATHDPPAPIRKETCSSAQTTPASTQTKPASAQITPVPTQSSTRREPNYARQVTSDELARIVISAHALRRFVQRLAPGIPGADRVADSMATLEDLGTGNRTGQEQGELNRYRDWMSKHVEPHVRDLIASEGFWTTERPSWSRSNTPSDGYLQVGGMCGFPVAIDDQTIVLMTCTNGKDITWEIALQRGYTLMPRPFTMPQPIPHRAPHPPELAARAWRTRQQHKGLRAAYHHERIDAIRATERHNTEQDAAYRTARARWHAQRDRAVQAFRARHETRRGQP